MSRNNRLELMRQTARKLTGQAVQLDFETPHTKHPANGATYKVNDLPVVHIDPYFENKHAELFRILTHELAHVVLHFGILSPVKLSQRVTISAAAGVAKNIREQEAELQADKWRRYANTNYFTRERSSEGVFLAKLKTLLYYKTGE